MKVGFMLFLFVQLCSAVMANDLDSVKAIDLVIDKKLEELGQSKRSGIADSEFCRRLYLDIVGRIPNFDEMHKFLSDENPNKRALLIHQLFASKGYVSNFHNYWADLLKVTYIGDKLHSMVNYSEWIKESLRKNKSYDVMVKELITAEGDLYKPGNGATGFYAREVMQLDHTASTVKAFMGMSIECAQCHDHPFEDWTQKEFYQFAAYTTNVKLRVDPSPVEEKREYAKMRKVLKNRDFDEWIVLREAARVKHAEIVGNGSGYMRLPHDYKYKDGNPHDVMTANSLFGDTPKIDYAVKQGALQKEKNKKSLGPAINSKQVMAEWVASKDNIMFTYNIVNRLWHKVMGTELLGPLGNLEYGNKGTHSELTELLAKIMRDVEYDLPAFLKIIMHTKAYQSKALSIQVNETRYLFDGPVLRRMSAEELWDSLLSLTLDDPDVSVLEKFKYDGFTYFYEEAKKMSPADIIKYAETMKLNRGKFYKVNNDKADELKNPKPVSYYHNRASELRHPIRPVHMLKLFGQSTREVIDGASIEPSITQALYTMNGELEEKLIRDPKSYLNKKLSKYKDRQLLGQTYLAVLGRVPNELENARMSEFSQDDREDLVWALLNSNEFKFKR